MKTEKKIVKTDAMVVLDILEKALRSSNDRRINDVSADYDNNSGEIILEVDDGKEITSWLVASTVSIINVD